MNEIINLRNLTVDQIAAITDATFEGDPLGTDANKAYATGNVHNYLKALGLAATPKETFFVNPLFAGLGAPYFAKIKSGDSESCYTYVSGLGTGNNNKALIKIGNPADSYSDVLVFDQSGFYTFKGESTFNCVISAAVSITNGVHIFEDIQFSNDITISGGTVIFRNCQMVGTSHMHITGTAVVMIENARYWGPIDINDTLPNVILFLSNMEDIRANTGNSLLVPPGLITPQIILYNCRMEGIKNDSAGLITEFNNIIENCISKPTY